MDQILSPLLPSLRGNEENYILIRNTILNNGGTIQRYSHYFTLEDIHKNAHDFDGAHITQLYYSAHVALASFENNIKDKDKKQPRAEFKTEYIAQIKSLVVEIPLNHAGYVTIKDAQKAIKNSLGILDISNYLIINNGYSLQLFVILDRSLNYIEWIKLSNAWRNALRCVGLIFIEDSCINPLTCVWMPGTFNRTIEIPGPQVEIISKMEIPYSVEELEDTFSVYNISADETTRIDMDAISFAEYATKLKDVGNYELLQQECAQLTHISTLEEVDNDTLHAVLGITSFCENDKEATEFYLPSVAAARLEKKLIQFKSAGYENPTTCVKFDHLNPGKCDGCNYLGRINSPLRLAVQEAIEIPELMESESPFLPMGYITKNNKLFRVLAVTGEEVKICDYVGYLEDMGMEVHAVNPVTYFQFRFKIPYHGWIPLRFEAPMLYNKGGKDSIVDKCANAGIFMQENEIKLMKDYLLACAKERQSLGKPPAKIISQFGWDDSFTHFNIGNKCVSHLLDTATIAKDDAIAGLANAYTQRGSLERWVEITDLLAYPSMKFHAFGFFLGLGAPLIKFSGLSGATINLYSETSGTGKSSIGACLNGLYGDPKKLQFTADDTEISTFIKMGILNNLPIYIDEISPWDGDRISKFLYFSSGGKERARATQDANLRNVRTWSTIVITSSNRSMLDSLQMYSKSTEGQENRFFEIPILVTEHSDNFGRMVGTEVCHNLHGVAGDIYLKELVKMSVAGKLKNDLIKARDLYERNFKFSFLGEERFIANSICCAWAGAIYAKKFKIISDKIDINLVFSSINEVLLSKRKKRIEDKVTPLEIINLFIAEHQGKLVKVNRFENGYIEGSCPEDNIMGRVELLYHTRSSQTPYQGILMISLDAFKNYCRDKKYPFNAIIDAMKLDRLNYRSDVINVTAGIELTVKGTSSISAGLKCFAVDLPEVWLQGYKITRKDKNNGSSYTGDDRVDNSDDD